MGKTIVVAGSATPELQTDTLGAMKQRVAESVGLGDDTDGLDKAGAFINDIIDELNLWDRFSFLRKVSTDLPLTATNTLAFPTALFVPMDIQFVNQTLTPPRAEQPIGKVNYERFLDRIGRELDEGKPSVWTVRNHHTDRFFYFDRICNSQTIADFKARVHYYEQLTRPTSDDTRIVGPERLTVVVKTGARARMMQIHRPNSVAAWSAEEKRFQALKMAMTHSDERDQEIDMTMMWGPGNEVSSLQLSFGQAMWGPWPPWGSF